MKFYEFLIYCPLWVIVLFLATITDVIIHLMREKQEGIGYQVAYSAKIGDLALLGIVFIAITVLKRGVVLPHWLMNNNLHYAIILTSISLGIIVNSSTLETRSGKIADIYHDIVIAPMFLYFFIVLFPVIYFGGYKYEKISAISFVLLWASLVVYDILTERMNQREFLKKRGIKLW